jgi:hypothetical protein
MRNQGLSITALLSPPIVAEAQRELCRQSLGKQAVVLLLDHGIALAGALFEPLAIHHRDVAAPVSPRKV